MYREDYKVTVPQFKRLEVLLSDCGAISGKLDIETGRHNARVINDKVKELSENGGLGPDWHWYPQRIRRQRRRLFGKGHCRF